MGLHKQGISFEPSLCNSTYLLKLMMTVSDCHKKKVDTLQQFARQTEKKKITQLWEF